MNWANTIMKVLEKIMFIVLLNILWLLGTALGLFIIGVAPATASLYKLLNEKELFEERSEIKIIISSFFRNYKKLFIASNMTFVGYLILFYLLVVDYNIIKNIDVAYSLFRIPLFIVALYTIGTLIFFIPVSLFSVGNIKQKVRLIFMTPLLMPITNIVNLVVLSSLVLFSFLYPLGGILAFVSIGTLTISFISMKALKKKKLLVEVNTI